MQESLAALEMLRETLGDRLVGAAVADTASGLTLATDAMDPGTAPLLQRLHADVAEDAELAGTGLADYEVISIHDGVLVLVTGPRRFAAARLSRDADLVWALGEAVPALRRAVTATQS